MQDVTGFIYLIRILPKYLHIFLHNTEKEEKKTQTELSFTTSLLKAKSYYLAGFPTEVGENGLGSLFLFCNPNGRT